MNMVVKKSFRDYSELECTVFAGIHQRNPQILGEQLKCGNPLVQNNMSK